MSNFNTIESELNEIKRLERSVFEKIENSPEFKKIMNEGDYISELGSNLYPIVKFKVSNPKKIEDRWLLIDFK